VTKPFFCQAIGQKSGFSPAGKAGVTREQSLFFQHACLRVADIEQFVEWLNV